MFDDPLDKSARAARPRTRCLSPRRVGADAGIRGKRAGRFRDRRDRRRRRHAGLQACRIRLFGRGVRCRPLFPAAGGLCIRRKRADQALLDRRPHRRRRKPAADGQQQQRQGGRRLDRAFRHGLAPLSSRMVQVAQPARLWRGLAARLARNVGLLQRGRAGAEDCRPGHLSLGAASSALSLSCASAQRRRPRACQRMRGDGHQMDRNAAGDVIGAAGTRPPLRLSRLLRDRLLDQRQAKRAGDLDSARDRGRRRNPRSRHGRQDRDRYLPGW